MVYECFGKSDWDCPGRRLGTRMKPFKLWKELIPVGYKEYSDGQKSKFIPKLIAEYTIDNMVRAGAKRIVMVLNEQKIELLRFFGNGSLNGASIAYLCQDTSRNITGMPIAIDEGYRWLKDCTVMMGMPDTIVEPFDCFKQLLEMSNEKKADLTLGVFPTNKPHRLAPVVINSNTSKVEIIYDKPKETRIFNTWNIAVWSNRFTELLHEYVWDYVSKKENTGTEILLSDIFNAAIKEGLNVYAKFFKTAGVMTWAILMNLWQHVLK
ncbi:nucleotidyltransferase family protein [Acetivibrio straminisolvens]|uniref:Glucose-1-phosphate thymidylyltransferase n=1 Tax=Acetivibrio straminisolvens JCM 21531 TaxID=1294263 RepID=W4V269_9FIRM|nr:sugar phosphate nucleotidyltransferase [Acetivibrio straminisolvens]GAE87560.1 glucose-1-phosphate thymidylyltransferase [Acetivibrio straminisolvens JCM 21531]